MKLTEWFPGKVKPARRGWYEVRCEYEMFGGGERLYWNGSNWISNGLKSDFGQCCDTWRGLAKKP
ncbi:hypothetical protein [Methylibium sp.]|uniref:hypothetical protein n=1 Tax=Methylibium sp. TaxID=2067992 RepID=UPI003BA97FC8